MANTHGNAAANRPVNAPRSRSFVGAFGRMFRELPPWEPKGSDEATKIKAIADIAAEMEESSDTPEGNSANIPAGYTFFGQFIDHDITFDPRSSLQKANDPNALEDFRTPAFDLDCVYGRGPDDQPYLYDSELPPKKRKTLLGASGKDLPRSTDGTVIISDMRNDENTIVSQLQLAFLKFHNEVVTKVGDENPGFDNGQIFNEAQRIARWHYQWVVINDWLKRLCGPDIVDDCLNLDGDGRYGKPNLHIYHYSDYPYMPVEFSVAAYRLPHSMMRANYKLNNAGAVLPLFREGAETGDDLTGFQPVPPKNAIEWCHFLEFEGKPKPSLSRKIDPKLCSPVIHLPKRIAEPVTGGGIGVEQSLAFRNLLRGFRMNLPSGQSVARRIGADEVLELGDGNTPLWRYMLEEAMAQQNGDRLGEVGSLIVTETFVGLLAGDPSSFYSTYPKWTPELEKEGTNFELRDIIKFAKAPI